YDIEGEIARGGVGAVFRARERDSGKPFALKVLIDGDDVGETERDRFRHECETAKALSLPGMVHVHEVGTHDGRPYMAMELVEGKSLDKVISERTLTVNDCLVLMKSVADTVGALHEAGYVHRDIKPGNILLDSFGTPKVADFGLVKSLDEVTRMTASGLVCGTPAYMSPEQARGEGKNVEPRSDVWALGAVLYEMLAGEPPFKADNALKLMLRITKEQPRKLTNANRKVPRDVEAIVNKCLEKNPARRYVNGRALAVDLGTFLEGGKLELTTESKMQRMLAAAAKNRAKIVPSVAALIAIGIIGIVAHAIFAGRSAAPLIEQGFATLKETPGNDDKKLQLAQRSFQDAIALEPQNGKAYLGLSFSLARRGIDQSAHRILNPKFVEEAFRANDYAAKLDPALQADSLASAAKYYTWLGRNVNAAAKWEQLVRSNPKNLDFRNALALSYWNAGVEVRDPKYYQLAVTEFKTILAAKPDYPKIQDYIKNIEHNFLVQSNSGSAVGMAGQH
ncbi:MAG TPA: protein kinase, partial [Planctomycetota bacterium]|nr:protein kinase [Planctomycetota bacterium]